MRETARELHARNCAWVPCAGRVAARTAAPRDRSANAADTAGSIALGSRSGQPGSAPLGAVGCGLGRARRFRQRGAARGWVRAWLRPRVAASVRTQAVDAHFARTGDCWNDTAFKGTLRVAVFTEAAQRRPGVLEGEPSAMLPAVSAALAEGRPEGHRATRSGQCK